jgi:hypothetical protein
MINASINDRLPPVRFNDYSDEFAKAFRELRIQMADVDEQIQDMASQGLNKYNNVETSQLVKEAEDFK